MELGKVKPDQKVEIKHGKRYVYGMQPDLAAADTAVIRTRAPEETYNLPPELARK